VRFLNFFVLINPSAYIKNFPGQLY